MKLVSWNVNGLRACLKKDFLGSFSEIGADIFCLQETKMEQGQAEIDLNGAEKTEKYYEYWNSADKKGIRELLCLLRCVHSRYLMV